MKNFADEIRRLEATRDFIRINIAQGRKHLVHIERELKLDVDSLNRIQRKILLLEIESVMGT